MVERSLSQRRQWRYASDSASGAIGQATTMMERAGGLAAPVSGAGLAGGDARS
jgi:hypothetical protein